MGAVTVMLPALLALPMRRTLAVMLARSPWARPRLPGLGLVPRSMFSVPGFCSSVTMPVPALIADWRLMVFAVMVMAAPGRDRAVAGTHGGGETAAGGQIDRPAAALEAAGNGAEAEETAGSRDGDVAVGGVGRDAAGSPPSRPTIVPPSTKMLPAWAVRSMPEAPPPRVTTSPALLLPGPPRLEVAPASSVMVPPAVVPMTGWLLPPVTMSDAVPLAVRPRCPALRPLRRP